MDDIEWFRRLGHRPVRRTSTTCTKSRPSATTSTPADDVVASSEGVGAQTRAKCPPEGTVLTAQLAVVGGQLGHVDRVAQEPAQPEEVAERPLVLGTGQPHLAASRVVERGVVPQQR